MKTRHNNLVENSGGSWPLIPNPKNYNTRSKSKEDQQTDISQQPDTPFKPQQPIEPILRIDPNSEAIPEKETHLHPQSTFNKILKRTISSLKQVKTLHLSKQTIISI